MMKVNRVTEQVRSGRPDERRDDELAPGRQHPHRLVDGAMPVEDVIECRVKEHDVNRFRADGQKLRHSNQPERLRMMTEWVDTNVEAVGGKQARADRRI